MGESQSNSWLNYRTALTLYYATLVLFVIGSFATGWRVWGFNFGAFLPEGIGIILMIVVALAPWSIDRFISSGSISGRRMNAYLFSAFSLTFIFSVLFVLLRTRTHFLGDGYTAISLLEVDKPLLKMREMGESYAHLWVRDLIGSGKSAAISSFRVISIGSGIVATIISLWTGSKLHGRSIKALLFTLMILSGGYAMLFFGYVENYSLFMASVIAVVLSGVLATRDYAPKWLPLLLALIAASMHTLGVIFIPAALFVALKKTPPGRFFAQSRIRLITLVAVLIAVTVAAAIWFYQSNQFVRFSFLTLTANAYTVGGYTLFAWDHLADTINLLFLLVPSLLLGLWLLAVNWTDIRRSFTYQFLGLAFISALVALFLIDPKLGMPRDWDLLAFVGVPLTAIVALLILEIKTSRQKQIVTLLLVLNFSVLAARLIIIDSERPAVAQFSSYLDLDIGKSRPGSFVLFKYYQERGRKHSADSLQLLWKDRYPEMYIMDTVNIDMRRRDFVAAAEKLERILKLTPTNHDALSNLGTCYTYLGKYDSALVLLNLAVGFNPYNVAAWTNLGTIAFKQDDFEQAEKDWLKAYEMDSLSFTAPGNLARLYKKTGDKTKWLSFLRKAAVTRDAPPKIYADLAEYYIDERNYIQAAGLYRFGLQRGLDSSVVKEARAKYHPLDSIMSGS